MNIGGRGNASRGTGNNTILSGNNGAATVKKKSVQPQIPQARTSLPPSRADKKPVTTYVSRATHRKLRLLGIELDKSNQEMLGEALAAYLAQNGVA